jgi:hypothetical protein
VPPLPPAQARHPPGPCPRARTPQAGAASKPVHTPGRGSGRAHTGLPAPRRHPTGTPKARAKGRANPAEAVRRWTAPAFPEVVAATAQLPDPSAFDGELIVWESDRLAISRLQDRLRRRGAAAARVGQEWPAHFVAFDLLRLSGTDTTGWSCRRRRAALDQSRGRRCRGWARRGCCARRPPPRRPCASGCADLGERVRAEPSRCHALTPRRTGPPPDGWRRRWIGRPSDRP